MFPIHTISRSMQGPDEVYKLYYKSERYLYEWFGQTEERVKWFIHACLPNGHLLTQ